MYTISIKLDMNRIPKDAFDTLREKHHVWYKTYFDAGRFLILGTCPDVSGESLIIAQGTREELEEAVQFDAYYADQLATYKISEFKVELFNEAIKNYID
ncbi:YciI family protein [Veillonella sp.]